MKKKIQDYFFMKKTIFLAKKGKYTTHPNPNVGCIIVKKKKIVGIGWHHQSGQPHAEVHAINMAGILTTHSTAYISLEPCNFFGKTPPCCDLIIKSKIIRVVIATFDPNPKVFGQSIKYLKKYGIKTTTGILSHESKKINYGFFKRMQTGIPWITLKMAISIDGKTSMKTGESKWITSHQSRQNVHKFRALHSAILSTSTTILKDNPILSVRFHKKNTIKKILSSNYKPIRIIIDSKNKIHPNHNVIIKNTGPIWLIRLYKDNYNWPSHTKQILLPSYKNKINLKKLFYYLGKNDINTIWTECGPSLCSTLINMKIIDQIILYIAPKIFGHIAKPLYLNEKIITLNQTLQYNLKNIKKFGSDIRVILTPKAS